MERQDARCERRYHRPPMSFPQNDSRDEQQDRASQSQNISDDHLRRRSNAQGSACMSAEPPHAHAEMHRHRYQADASVDEQQNSRDYSPTERHSRGRLRIVRVGRNGRSVGIPRGRLHRRTKKLCSGQSSIESRVDSPTLRRLWPKRPHPACWMVNQFDRLEQAARVPLSALAPARRPWRRAGARADILWAWLLAEGTYSPTCKHVGVLSLDCCLHGAFYAGGYVVGR